jgi:hypothetical protein
VDGLCSLDLVDRGEDLLPLSACLPLELLLNELAARRGREAGTFTRIGKVTTRE